MPEVTAQASGRWIGMSLDCARKKGYSILLEGTFRNTEMVVNNAKSFANREGAGYTVEVSALAVNGKRSRLDSVGRYLYSGEGRWTSLQSHDEAYDNVPKTVEALEGSADISRIVVTDRSGVDLYVNERGVDGRWIRTPEAANFLKEHRGLPFAQQEAREWISDYWSHAGEIIRRGELNGHTAPTMLALYADADQIAPVAYEGQAKQLSQHTWCQKLQKQVFMAGRRGVDNTKLPSSPQEYFSATPEERRNYLEAMKDTKTAQSPQQKLAPPKTRKSPPDGGRPNRGLQKDPDLER